MRIEKGSENSVPLIVLFRTVSFSADSEWLKKHNFFWQSSVIFTSIMCTILHSVITSNKLKMFFPPFTTYSKFLKFLSKQNKIAKKEKKRENDSRILCNGDLLKFPQITNGIQKKVLKYGGM